VLKHCSEIMVSKKNRVPSGPVIPWTTCQECQTPDVVIHSRGGDLWCPKCGHYAKAEKKAK